MLDRDDEAHVKPQVLPYPEEPIHYVLKRPCTFKAVDQNSRTGELIEHKVTEVWVREPIGDDTLTSSKGKTEVEVGLRLMAAMCDQPFAFIKALSGYDQTKIGGIVERFFPKEA